MHDTTVATTALFVLLAWGGVGALFFWERFLRDALRRFRRRSRLSQALVVLGLAALVAIGGIRILPRLAVSNLHFVSVARNKAGEYGVAVAEANLMRISEEPSLYA